MNSMDLIVILTTIVSILGVGVIITTKKQMAKLSIVFSMLLLVAGVPLLSELMQITFAR